MIRRTLAGIAAGFAIHPASQSATVKVEQVETDADAALKSIQYDTAAMPVRSQYLTGYTGPKCEMTESMLLANMAARKWRNASLAGNAETEIFIEERTR